MSLLYNTYINTVEFVKGCFSAIDHDSFLKIMDYVGTDIESRFLERCAMKHCGCSVQPCHMHNRVRQLYGKLKLRQNGLVEKPTRIFLREYTLAHVGANYKGMLTGSTINAQHVDKIRAPGCTLRIVGYSESFCKRSLANLGLDMLYMDQLANCFGFRCVVGVHQEYLTARTHDTTAHIYRMEFLEQFDAEFILDSLSRMSGFVVALHFGTVSKIGKDTILAIDYKSAYVSDFFVELADMDQKIAASFQLPIVDVNISTKNGLPNIDKLVRLMDTIGSVWNFEMDIDSSSLQLEHTDRQWFEQVIGHKCFGSMRIRTAVDVDADKMPTDSCIYELATLYPNVIAFQVALIEKSIGTGSTAKSLDFWQRVGPSVVRLDVVNIRNPIDFCSCIASTLTNIKEVNFANHTYWDDALLAGWNRLRSVGFCTDDITHIVTREGQIVSTAQIINRCIKEFPSLSVIYLDSVMDNLKMVAVNNLQIEGPFVRIRASANIF